MAEGLRVLLGRKTAGVGEAVGLVCLKIIFSGVTSDNPEKPYKNPKT
jgi:hypothetical protein